jgi:hypothetical protein
MLRESTAAIVVGVNTRPSDDAHEGTSAAQRCRGNRQRLLAAATELFAERGFGVTLADIATMPAAAPIWCPAVGLNAILNRTRGATPDLYRRYLAIVLDGLRGRTEPPIERRGLDAQHKIISEGKIIVVAAGQDKNSWLFGPQTRQRVRGRPQGSNR